MFYFKTPWATGQERAFFLRFRGEGVLDNGGPCVSSFRLIVF